MIKTLAIKGKGFKKEIKFVLLLLIWLIFLGLIEIIPVNAEPPAERDNKTFEGVDVPKGTVTDTYIVYRDFRIPIRFFSDGEIPGHIKIIDHQNTLWVAKRSDIRRLFSRLLPKELERVMKEADGYYDSYRIDKALIEYKRLLKLLPQNPYLHLRIGQCLIMLQREKEAMEYFQSTLKLAPNNHQAINELGLIQFSKGKYNQALDYFSKASNLSRNMETYKLNINETRLAIADQELSKGNYKEALSQVARVMATFPDYSNKELPAREETIFRRYLETNAEIKDLRTVPKKSYEELWVDAGRYLAEGNLWAEAITLFRTLNEQYPENKTYKDYLIDAYLSHGNDLFAQEKWKNAVEVYQEAKNFIPTEELLNQSMLKFLEDQGTQKYNNGKYSEAVDYLARFNEIFPENQNIQKMLAKSYYQEAKGYSKDHRYTEALESAKKAFSVIPKGEYSSFAADMEIALGQFEYDDNNWDQAMERFGQALKLHPTHIQARRLFYQTKIRKTFAEQALVAFAILAFVIFITLGTATSLTRIRKRRILSRTEKAAEVAYAKGDWQSAIMHFENYRKIAKKVGRVQIFERLAECYANIGEYNNAILNYNRAEDFLGGERRYFMEKCKIFALKGNAELTTQYLKESPNIEEASETLLQYCQGLFENAKNAVAKDNYREVLGALHLIRGELNVAKNIFEDMHAHKPRSLYPLRKLINIAKEEKKSKSLKDYLEKYLEIDSENPAVISDLGEYYESIGRKKEALDRYAESYELNPVEKIRLKIRQLAKEFMDNLVSDEAETVGTGAASTESMQHILEILMKIKDYEISLEFLQKLTSAGVSEPWVLRQMANCFYVLSVDDMAIKYYRRYLDQYRKGKKSSSMDTEEKEVVYNLARTYERKGLLDLALAEYQSIYEQDLKFKDVALKIPTLYEQKMKEEKNLSEIGKGRPSPEDLARPQEGQIRCPKCLHIIASDLHVCPFCNCKLGYSELELEEQAAKRRTRMEHQTKALPPGEGQEAEET